MESLNTINNLIKYIFLALIDFYVVAKLINYNKISKNKIILTLIMSILAGFIYTFLIQHTVSLIILSLFNIILAFYISSVSRLSFENSLVVSFVSIAITISFYLVALLCTMIIVNLPFISLDKQNTIIIFICVFIELFFLYKFFNISRFKNGFAFLINTERNYTFSIVGLILGGILIILYSVSRNNLGTVGRRIGIIGFALIIIGTFIWIKRNITLDYQDRMKNRKIENLEKELADKEKINAELTEEIKSLTMINHQYNSRIKAAKQEIEKLAFAFKNSTNTEFSTELSEVTKLVNNLSSEYSNKVNSVLKYSKPLPKTNVKGVDSILEHMKLEATKKNIDFDLKVNCSVKHLIEKFISQSELETLISDHVKDAIIAVGYSESTPRSICVIFDIIDNCYRFSVYDSGIDFEINTLVNLGLDAITTHKDDGGTGLGFLTTFGTLDKCKASLVIDEINFKNSNFSKSVNIIFDEKHEYIVRSSRTEEIKKFDKNSRIILQNKD